MPSDHPSLIEIAGLAVERFLRGPSWEAAASEVLARLGGALCARQLAIFENHDRNQVLAARRRALWASEATAAAVGRPTVPGQLLPSEFAYRQHRFGRWRRHLVGGRAINTVSEAELVLDEATAPDEGSSGAEEVRSKRAAALLLAPIFVDGAWWGVLAATRELSAEATAAGESGAQAVGAPWEPPEVAATTVVAGLLGVAIERQRVESRLLSIERAVESAGEAIVLADGVHGVRYLNPAFRRLIGYTSAELQRRGGLQSLFADPELADRIAAAVARGGSWAGELELVTQHGEQVPVRLRADATDAIGDEGGYVAVVTDIRAERRREQLERDRRQVLESVARNDALDATLACLVALVERQLPDATAAVAVADGGRLQQPVAPHLPVQLLSALADLSIARTAGSMGQAALLGSPVYHRDIRTNPAWPELVSVMTAHGFEAAWSSPILGRDGRVLGVISTLFREQRHPHPQEMELLALAAQLGGIAIEQQQLLEQLERQARRDSLTGLPNRLALEERVSEAIAKCHGHGSRFALLFIDLDLFKKVNDSLGHHVGDALLREVAGRFRRSLRSSDTLARVGGDEFALLLEGIHEADEVLPVTRKLTSLFEQPFALGGREIYMSATIGVSVYPDDGEEFATLFKHADAAMYQGKRSGRNTFRFFTAELNAMALERLELEGLLREALRSDAFALHFQLLVTLAKGAAPARGAARDAVHGVEALLRWEHPERGPISPAVFVPVAEETGLIVELGRWVLRQACRQAVAWEQAGRRPLRVAVNVSAVQFARPDFVETVAAELTAAGLEPSRLELEVTESVVMGDIDTVAARLAQLREVGVRVYIDDFGTGYSSLAYLQRLPIDGLKIDRSFVAAATNALAAGDAPPGDDQNRAVALLKAIVALAHSLELQVVAEGVETAAQAELLRGLGCDLAQGYYFGRPTPAAALAVRLVAE